MAVLRRSEPGEDAAPLAVASATCFSIFSIAAALIIGPIATPSSVPGPTFMALTRSESLRGESVVDAGLHQDAVSADAGLAAIAELEATTPSMASSRSASSKTMKGALPPSSRLSRLMLSAAPRHQQRADAGRPGEGNLAHGLVGQKLLADRAGHPGDDVDDTRRNARALGKDRRAPAPNTA